MPPKAQAKRKKNTLYIIKIKNPGASENTKNVCAKDTSRTHENHYNSIRQMSNCE
jgi:hypothetical protein